MSFALWPFSFNHCLQSTITSFVVVLELALLLFESDMIQANKTHVKKLLSFLPFATCCFFNEL